MLKRQRPVSPPSSMPTVPLVTSESSMDSNFRDVKRRRVLPPVLDGPSRGWGRPDDYNEEDEEENLLDSPCSDSPEGSRPVWHDTAEYKSTNRFLNELHTLHQHRLLLSTSLPFSSHPTQSDHSLSTQYPGKSTLLPPERPGARLDTPTKSAVRNLVTKFHDIRPTLKIVTDRYEDTNRLLGSLVLSRRRELGSSPPPSFP